jgi:hypothetical protein
MAFAVADRVERQQALLRIVASLHPQLAGRRRNDAARVGSCLNKSMGLATSLSNPEEERCDCTFLKYSMSS